MAGQAGCREQREGIKLLRFRVAPGAPHCHGTPVMLLIRDVVLPNEELIQMKSSLSLRRILVCGWRDKGPMGRERPHRGDRMGPKKCTARGTCGNDAGLKRRPRRKPSLGRTAVGVAVAPDLIFGDGWSR